MSRKRAIRWALALVVGMSARVLVAAPTASIAELRAVACCATHCPAAPARPMRSHRCCIVGSSAADPATPAATSPDASPVLNVVDVAVPALATVADCAIVPAPLGADPPGHREILRLRC